MDATHDPARQSWVTSANGHPEFPIQNLPIGIFSDDRGRRGGIAIGDSILDVAGLAALGALRGDAAAASAALSGASANAFLALGSRHRRALRCAVSELLSADNVDAQLHSLVLPAADCTLHLPADIGDYTDFYAGIHHALAVGKLFRPGAPLLANYKHVPIAYHGRASSVRPSDTPVRRPRGQIKAAADSAPTYVAAQRLDFELELGMWVGPGSELGTPVPIAAAAEHIAGFCLLNDWSARDVQAWEYQPLGPFLAKNFLTSVSPWVITPEALEPFRTPQAVRSAGDPRPLPYLWDPADQAGGALNLDLQVDLRTAAMRDRGLPPERLSRSNARHLYWTPAQMLTHHTSGGCDLRAGDLFGSGTISADDGSGGSLLELSAGGTRLVSLANGEVRTFLQDGDEIILRAHAHRLGCVSLGFGECRGTVLPSTSA